MDCFSLLLGVVLPPRTSFMTGQALSSCVAARGSGVVPLLFGLDFDCASALLRVSVPILLVAGGYFCSLPSLDNVGVLFTGGSSF